MRINYVRLHNIRSYKECKIEFKEGSTLLYGDIGSGKTTILLAIEFAIFGFVKSEISGNLLLRHGENLAFVELCFNIDKKEVKIYREIKRSQNGIMPTKCLLTIDGLQESLMPTEIRERIFDLLKYPKAFVSKNPTLIYRYTIYTPQEQLKQIIYDDSSSRIEILRKIFDIDKYKKIISNAEIYEKFLKDKIKEQKGQIYDLEELNKIKKEIQKNQELLKFSEEKIKKEHDKIKEKSDFVKKEYDEILLQIKERDSLKKEIEFVEIKINEKKEELQKTTHNTEILEKEIAKLNLNIDKNIQTLEEKDLSFLKAEILDFEKKYNNGIIEIEKGKEKKKILEKRIIDIKETISKKEAFSKEQFSSLDEETIKQRLFDIDALKTKLKEGKKESESLIDEQKNDYFKLLALIEKSKELEEEITKLENCPTCFQKVSEEHKFKIHADETKKQKVYEEKMTFSKNRLAKLKNDFEKLNERLDELQNEQMALDKRKQSLFLKKQTAEEIKKLSDEEKEAVTEIKKIDGSFEKTNELKSLFEKINERKKELEKITEENKKRALQKSTLEKIRIYNNQIDEQNKRKETIKETLGELNSKKEQSNDKMKKFDKIKEKEQKIMTEKKEVEEELGKKTVELASVKRDIQNTKQNFEEITEKINYKNNIKMQIENNAKKIDFLCEKFVNLMQAIEIRKLQKIHSVFNHLFKKWFSVLIDEEAITVRLDENFNPIAEQNGFDTSIYHLSGGEKTSLALSYRLSLTKTINQILVNQTTNSLLILDEPTDGFSSNQLDKLRDVLSEIDIMQIIVVSHESKIESFVNNTVLISKKEHISLAE